MNKIKEEDKIVVNPIQIEIRPFGEGIKDAIEAFKKVERGERVKFEKITFNDLDTLRSILTKERMRLMHCIRLKKPESIYELAKDLDRNWRLVAKDVELLNNVGLVKLERKKKPREVIKPIVDFNRMNVSVSI